MAKVQSAAKAIQDELNQARKAVAHYTKRVEDLEDILNTLKSIDAPVASSRRRSGKKEATAKGAVAKATETAPKGTRSSKLPATGKEFWPGLLNDTPQSSAQIFKAALSALRIRPTPDDRKKLSQRMSNALSVLAKNGEITAEGGHRTRMYSRKTPVAA